MNRRVRSKLSDDNNFTANQPVAELVSATHQLGVATTAAEAPRGSAVGHPDVDPAALDDAARIVGEEPSVRPTAEEEVHFTSEREQRPVHGDDAIADRIAATGASLQAVRRNRDGDALTGPSPFLEAAKETPIGRERRRHGGRGHAIHGWRHGWGVRAGGRGGVDALGGRDIGGWWPRQA